MRKTLPALSHLQFIVLAVIRFGKSVRGQEVRDYLKDAGIKKTGPAFYQLMARLEEAGFVRGWYDQQVVEGQVIKQRVYQITAAGLKAFRESVAFYGEFDI